MITERPKQYNCQVEPSFPDHETVVFSIRDPDYYMGSDCRIKKFESIKDDMKKIFKNGETLFKVGEHHYLVDKEAEIKEGDEKYY